MVGFACTTLKRGTTRPTATWALVSGTARSPAASVSFLAANIQAYNPLTISSSVHCPSAHGLHARPSCPSCPPLHLAPFPRSPFDSGGHTKSLAVFVLGILYVFCTGSSLWAWEAKTVAPRVSCTQSPSSRRFCARRLWGSSDHDSAFIRCVHLLRLCHSQFASACTSVVTTNGVAHVGTHAAPTSLLQKRPSSGTRSAQFISDWVHATQNSRALALFRILQCLQNARRTVSLSCL